MSGATSSQQLFNNILNSTLSLTCHLTNEHPAMTKTEQKLKNKHVLKFQSFYKFSAFFPNFKLLAASEDVNKNA